MSVKPSIAVVIPVKNGFPEIKDCIQGLLNQTLLPTRIIVIDSGSTDGTLEYLATVPEVTIHSIEANTFNHGLTRNLGIEYTEEEFLYYTVQDAAPVSTSLLSELISCFEEPQLMAVCGAQVVPHDVKKNPLEWFFPYSEPEKQYTVFDSFETFDKLPPAIKLQACSWDNVNALYRREALEKVKFSNAVFGEDMLWARDAYRSGFKLGYWGKARVRHYHLEDANFSFKRNFTTHYFRYLAFKYVPKVNPLSFVDKLRILKTLVKRLGTNIRAIKHWYQYNVTIQKAAYESYQQFVAALELGENNLDQVHERLCGKPPVPLKQV